VGDGVGVCVGRTVVGVGVEEGRRVGVAEGGIGVLVKVEIGVRWLTSVVGCAIDEPTRLSGSQYGSTTSTAAVTQENATIARNPKIRNGRKRFDIVASFEI
jgi:hypothetical protein